MPELPPGGAQVAAEVAAISSGPGTIQERAEALLRPLGRIVPFCLGRFTMPDPDLLDRRVLVESGSSDSVVGYFDSPAVVRDMLLIGLDRPHPPMCLSDLPVPARQLTGWTDYLWPAGIQDGLAVGLFAPDGRHLGIITLYTDSTRHPSTSARDLIGALSPIMASAVDPMRSLQTAAALVRDARFATVLTRCGGTRPLPGLPGHPLLAERSRLLGVVAQRLAAGHPRASFLCPYDNAPDGHLRVTALVCPEQPPYHLSGVAVLAPADDLAGLTRRELEVLGLLGEGLPDEGIATGLGITRRTVAAHMEHILGKLGLPNRTAAAVRAVRTGLLIPPELARTRMVCDGPATGEG